MFLFWQDALAKYVALFPEVEIEAQFYCEGLAPGLKKYKNIEKKR